MICVCNDVRTLASNTGLGCVKAPCLRSLGNLCFISEVRVQSDPEPGVLLIPFRREGSWPSKPLPPRTGVHSGWLTPMLPLPSRVSPSVIQNPCFAALSVTCILNPHLNDHSLFMFHVSYLFCLSFLVSFSLHHPEKKNPLDSWFQGFLQLESFPLSYPEAVIAMSQLLGALFPQPLSSHRVSCTQQLPTETPELHVVHSLAKNETSTLQT